MYSHSKILRENKDRSVANSISENNISSMFIDDKSNDNTLNEKTLSPSLPVQRMLRRSSGSAAPFRPSKAARFFGKGFGDQLHSYLGTPGGANTAPQESSGARSSEHISTFSPKPTRVPSRADSDIVRRDMSSVPFTPLSEAAQAGSPDFNGFSQDEHKEIQERLKRWDKKPKFFDSIWNRTTTQVPKMSEKGMGLHAPGGTLDPMAHQGGPTGGFIGSSKGSDIAPEILGSTADNHGVLSDGTEGGEFILNYKWDGTALDVNRTRSESGDVYEREHEGLRTSILEDEIKEVYKIPMVRGPGTHGRSLWGKNPERKVEIITEQMKEAMKLVREGKARDVFEVLRWIKIG